MIIDVANMIHADGDWRGIKDLDLQSGVWLPPIATAINALNAEHVYIVLKMRDMRFNAPPMMTIRRMLEKVPNSIVYHYTGVSQNGDDAVCMMLARVMGGIIISNDRMDKPEDLEALERLTDRDYNVYTLGDDGKPKIIQ